MPQNNNNQNKNIFQQALDSIFDAINPPKTISPLAQDPNFDVGAQNAINQIRKYKPDKNISDDQIKELHKKYGDAILQDIYPKEVLDKQAKAPRDISFQQAQNQSDYALPSGLDAALGYVKGFTPQGQDVNSYYPALGDPEFMKGLLEADKVRPGIANLLLMMGFHESTLGRNGNNLFGVLPGGEGSGRNAQFGSAADALNYELGPNVLGGGANPNMNVMGEKGPLTMGRVNKLFESYNPEGAYIDTIRGALKPTEGNNR